MTARVERLIANALEDRIRNALTAGDVLEALQALDTNQRAKVLEAIRANNINAAGRAFLMATNALVNQRAVAQSQTYLADGTLTTAELTEIFG